MDRIVKFDYGDNITYKEYHSIIEKLKSWYEEKRKQLKQEYELMLKTKNYSKSTEIMEMHRKIIEELLSKIIYELKLDKENFGIYISNSFARSTNLLNSDIDINFVYEDKSDFIYEELISSILVNVVSKYRDFVHDSISHRMSEERASEDDFLLFELNFKDKVIINEITKGNISMMYRLYHTKKDLESFIKYYIKYITDDEINEWVYAQNVIYDKNNYLKPLFDYIKTLGIKVNKKKFNKRVDFLLKEIEEERNEILSNEILDIKTLKQHYKNHAFKIINEFLVLTSMKEDKLCIETTKSKIDRLNNKKLSNKINRYLGRIMSLDYICEQYGIEFRTRYSQPISDDFLKFYKSKTGEPLISLRRTLMEIYEIIYVMIKSYKKNASEEKFDVETEHINIQNYSPLWAINDVSDEYKKNYYLLPFIDDSGKCIPIHPDLLKDLKIPRSRVVKEEMVFPTSSTRTVYEEEKNICYKLPVKRQITRSIRDLPNKELERSILATSYLEKYNYPGFHIIKEDCFYNEFELYNYIIRYMPDRKVYPWFYLIVSNKYDKEFMLKIIRKIIDIWMFYASKGIYFESFHTQNLMVDDLGEIYYRDLSDIRILNEKIMRPSYIDELKGIEEIHSIFFDRSVLSQNIEHFIKYRTDLTSSDIERIKHWIYESMDKYKISLPDYSMDYDKTRDGHHPIKGEIARLRKL